MYPDAKRGSRKNKLQCGGIRHHFSGYPGRRNSVVFSCSQLYTSISRKTANGCSVRFIRVPADTYIHIYPTSISVTLIFRILLAFLAVITFCGFSVAQATLFFTVLNRIIPNMLPFNNSSCTSASGVEYYI